MAAPDDRATHADLGPFAPEQGSLDRTVVAGAALAAAAAALGLARPLADAFGSHGARWAPGAALAVAAIAIGVSLAGQYRVIAFARRGHALARTSVLAAFAAGLGSFLYAAIRDGTI